MASAHHTIDYIEFEVRDLAAAKRFYTLQSTARSRDGPDLGVFRRNA